MQGIFFGLWLKPIWECQKFLYAGEMCHVYFSLCYSLFTQLSPPTYRPYFLHN